MFRDIIFRGIVAFLLLHLFYLLLLQKIIVAFLFLLNKLNTVIFLTVHCGSIRQTASILSMSEECLRTGDKAVVHFRFIKHPEYLKPGQRMVFREGRTKAVGNVLRLIQAHPGAQTARVKPNKMLPNVSPTQQSNTSSTNNQQVISLLFPLFNQFISFCLLLPVFLLSYFHQ